MAKKFHHRIGEIPYKYIVTTQFQDNYKVFFYTFLLLLLQMVLQILLSCDIIKKQESNAAVQ